MINLKRKTYFIISSIIAILIGTFLHFFYDFSNNNILVGLLSPVNESVWEHLKLVFYPLVLFAVITKITRDENIFFPSSIAVLIGTITILIIHYTFKLFGIENISIDIISYILAMLISIYFIYKSNFKANNTIGIIIIIMIVLIFAIFTIFPPRIQLFLDESTNSYGIIGKVTIKTW